MRRWCARSAQPPMAQWVATVRAVLRKLVVAYSDKGKASRELLRRHLLKVVGCQKPGIVRSWATPGSATHVAAVRFACLRAEAKDATAACIEASPACAARVEQVLIREM